MIELLKKQNHQSFGKLSFSNKRCFSFRYLTKKKTWGLWLLCGGSLFCGGLLYLGNKKLRKRLRFVSDDSSREKGSPSYIYIDEESNVYHRNNQKNKKDLLLPYIQSRSHDPKRLLKLAQSDSHAVRLLGVKALAQPHNWTDADYCMLAQALDSRALIGLARMPNSDPRFFLSQPKLQNTEELIEDKLRHLLSSLPLDNLDLCTKYFTSSALLEGNQSKKDERGGMWCFGGNGLAFTQSVSQVPDEIVEIFCLQALEKHSVRSVWSFEGNMLSEDTISPSLWMENLCMHALLGASALPSHCPKIVDLGGLYILQRIYEARENNVKITRSIARILSNLAVHPSLHKDITNAGWITVLHKWLNGVDLALSMHAAKALANLDIDFAGHKKYLDGVYLYYPQKRYSEPVYADIVFVHGLMGGPFRTWRQKDSVLMKLKEEKKKRLQVLASDKSKKSNTDQNRNNLHDNNIKDKVHTEKDVNIKQDKKPVTKKSDNSNKGSDVSTKINMDDKDGSFAKSKELSTEREGIDEESTHKIKPLFDFSKFNPSKWDVKELFTGMKSKPKPLKKKALYTFCWPKEWLAKDIPNIRIITVEYDTHLSEWAPKCPYEGEKRALATRSMELLEKLRTAGIGERPVIWVGHSMGGLLIKQMLVNATTDVRYKNMVDKTKGIVFYSVPHKGSPLATYGNITKYLFNPSVEVKELKMGAPNLQDLHKKFKDMMFEFGIPLLSFAEGEKTDLPLNMKVMIVPPESSNPEFGEFYMMKNLNHLNICKPESDLSPLYRITLAFLVDCLPANRVPNILKATVPDEFVLEEEEVS